MYWANIPSTSLYIFAFSIQAILKPVPYDYENLHGIGYYKVHTDLKTWYEGKAVCEEEGAYLTVLNSHAEARAVTDMFNRRRYGDKHYAFIGFYDRAKSTSQFFREFVTVQGKYLQDFMFILFNQGYFLCHY